MLSGRSRGPAAVAAVVAAADSLYGLFRHWHFDSNYDLAIFDQAVWHLSRFEAPASTLSGYANILGDHFYPVVALFAPLYWVAAAPETLIVAQAILLALSILPVFAFLRRRLSHPVSLLLAFAYGLSWGIQQAAAFDVHEMAFAPLVIATLIDALDRRRWPLFWAMAAALVFVKEDLIAFLTGVGILLVFIGERRRGMLLAAGSIVVFAVVTTTVIPSLADNGAYASAGWYRDLLAEPQTLPLRLVTPLVKVRTALLWFAPFLLLSFASPLAWLVVPIAVERFLSSSPLHWGTIFHYSAPIAPIVAMSAGDGLARLSLRFGGVARAAIPSAATCVLLAAVLPGHPPLRRVFVAAHYRPISTVAAARAALATIPPDASVTTQGALAPHLTHRRDVYLLGREAPDTDYVIAAEPLNPWPLGDAAALRAAVEARRRGGYQDAFARDGWVVLKRTKPKQ